MADALCLVEDTLMFGLLDSLSALDTMTNWDWTSPRGGAVSKMQLPLSQSPHFLNERGCAEVQSLTKLPGANRWTF